MHTDVAIDVETAAIGDHETNPGTEFELASAVADTRAAIELQGLRVYQSTDFERVERRLLSEANWTLNDVAKHTINDLSTANTFFICIEDQAGKLIGFCSVRMQEVGEETLAGFLDRYYRRIYGAGASAIDPKELPPLARETIGRVGFISDLRIRQPSTGKVSAGSLMMLALSSCMMRFNPTMIYGFVSDRQMRRGLGAKYLVPRLYPAALKWKITPPWDPRDWMLCISREECRYLFRKLPETREPSVDRALCGVS